MTPGLISSVVNATLVPTRATIQLSLVSREDGEPVYVVALEQQVTELQQQLRISEAAYDGACDTLAALEEEARRLRQENTCLHQRVSDLTHVAVWGWKGRVVR